MTTRCRRTLVSYFFGVLTLIGLATSTIWIDKYQYRPSVHENLYLPSGKLVEQVSLGYREVVADFVWLSAVQYYGDFRRGDHDLRYFRGLIDIVTTLDPHFIFAYVFGALVMSEDVGSFEEGTEILKRGMAQNPTCWELPFEIGFLNFVNRRDNAVAAKYFELASNMPNAPEYTERFAAFVYSKAGYGESSIRIWEEYKERTDDPFLKELADRYIEKIRQSMTTEKATTDA